MGNYVVDATIPMHCENGQLKEGTENTKKATLEKAKERNEKYGFVTIKAEPTRRKEEKTGAER